MIYVLVAGYFGMGIVWLLWHMTFGRMRELSCLQWSEGCEFRIWVQLLFIIILTWPIQVIWMLGAKERAEADKEICY